MEEVGYLGINDDDDNDDDNNDNNDNNYDNNSENDNNNNNSNDNDNNNKALPSLAGGLSGRLLQRSWDCKPSCGNSPPSIGVHACTSQSDHNEDNTNTNNRKKV